MSDFDILTQEVISMKCSSRDGYSAPHKPVLLLSIIELFDKGYCIDNRIELTDTLQSVFKSIWDTYVKNDAPFNCVLNMPFYHMNSEPFWSLVKSDDYEMKNEYSLYSLKKCFKWAELSRCLYESLQDKARRDILRVQVLEHYFNYSVNDNHNNMEGADSIRLSHDVYFDILKSRGLNRIQHPIWKMKISDREYALLKDVLFNAYCVGDLEKYGREAALYYAEWWRRDYNGGVPSKEDVAGTIYIDEDGSEDLYRAARKSLVDLKFKFIVTQRTEYFRSMLSQGGIPINYIKSGNNFSCYSAFLRGLIRELSIINFDWNDVDSSIVPQLNCVSRLSRSFQNESIYDLSLQIAHAIIQEDDTLLPYDSDDDNLHDLTRALKNEYQRAKTERHVKPFSLSWRLTLNDSAASDLWYIFDPVKEIGSESISGISPDNCYSFDVIVGGKVISKYSRTKIEVDEESGGVLRAIYSRINIGYGHPIHWNGEPIVDVKVRCDDGARLFLTLPGSYPPDFSVPQSFQLIEGNVYSKSQTSNSENNIAIFSKNWGTTNVRETTICDQELNYVPYTYKIELFDSSSGESVELINEYTPYSVEYADTYIDWLECSNYKLCTHSPRIRVFDGEKNQISKVDAYYREHNAKEWKRLNKSTFLQEGLVQFKVVFPDNHYEVDTFYCINRLGFNIINQSFNAADISLHDNAWAAVEMEDNESIEIDSKCKGSWHISRKEGSTLYATTCAFHVFKPGNPTLRIEIPAPFVGISIVNSAGEIVPNKKMISYYNLYNYKIVNHGITKPSINISYSNGDATTPSQTIACHIPQGISPLSDYTDAIDRLFNFYVLDSFARSESVKLSVADQSLFVRKFILESKMCEDGKIEVVDKTDGQESGSWRYEGKLLAFPISDDNNSCESTVFEMDRESDSCNRFSFHEDFSCNRAIVFSDIADARRIVPKLFKLQSTELTLNERNNNRARSYEAAIQSLESEDLFTGMEWQKAYNTFCVASRYGLPFKTFTTLWAICSSPKLLATFLLGMWNSGNGDVLVQDISTYEQEFVMGVHWIQPSTWATVINDYIDYIISHYPSIASPMIDKFNSSFMEYFRNVYSVTLGPESATEFIKIVSQGAIPPQGDFMNSEMNEIKSKVVGITDDNRDLPRADLKLAGKYYPETSMKYYYTMMFHSPMVVAEYLCNLDDAVNIWSAQYMEQRKVINYYRQYFKSIYSKILIRTMGIITKKHQN